jgi:TolB-like protein/DNA-binding winged helix-turn-helix (wHTH) protein
LAPDPCGNDPRLKTADRVIFGDFQFNLSTGELYEGGQKVRLSGQPADVLRYLVRRAGTLVTREELRSALWPADTFVDFDHGVNSCIQRIRQALRDSVGAPRYIETLPKQGYRFIGAIRIAEEAAAAIGNEPGSRASSPRRALLAWAMVAALVALIAVAGIVLVPRWVRVRRGASGIHSLAVLPIENLSGDPEQEFFADGMTDELITMIAKNTPVRVISRTSVMCYKGARKPMMKEIARALDVDAVVEGSVLRAGGRVRITTQLIDARADKHLWAESYEGDLKDVLALQADVATAISRRLQPALNSRSLVPAVKAASNPEAHEAYLRGKYYLHKRTGVELKQSEEYFRRAIELDPGDASAYAALAEAYQIQGSWEGGYVAPNEAFPKAMAAAEKALQLDDTLADAHAALGYAKLYYKWDWPGAESELRKAIALNPSSEDGHHWFSHYLLSLGRVGDSLAESQRAIQMAPVDPLINVHLAWHYLFAREYEQAIEQARRVQNMDLPPYKVYLFEGLAFEQQGHFREAIEWLQKAVVSSGDISHSRSALGHAYGLSGDRAHAQQVLAELKTLSTRQYVPSYDIAIVYLGLGDREEAYRWLQKAYDERSAWMVYLNMDPRLDTLRSEARFKTLVRNVGLPEQSK